MTSKVLESVGLRREYVSPSEVSALHGSGNTLFVGHESGELIAYSLREAGAGVGAGEAAADLWAQASLKGSVQAIASASALGRLFVLADGHFALLRLEDLSEVAAKGSRLRGVSAFGLNQAPLASADDPFAVQLAFGLFGRERGGPGLVRVALLAGDKLSVTAEVHTDSAPLALAIDGSALCWGTRSEYSLHDLAEGTTQPLFPMDQGSTRPLVARVDKEEFVVSGMQGLGVFVAKGGVSKRPPFHWGVVEVREAAVVYPYLVGLGEENLAVHSLLDEGLKQELHLPQPRALANCDGQLFAASAHSLHKLPLVSWLSQIDSMLQEGRVSEAREVARFALKAGNVPDSAVDVFTRIDQRGVFVALEEGDWAEVEELALRSQLDLRELISLFPGLLPATSDFSRQSDPALHALPDVSALKGADEEGLWACLLAVLHRGRREGWTTAYRSELSTALVKATGFCRSEGLEELLGELGGAYDGEECQRWLREKASHHSLATLQAHGGDWAQALQLWQALEEEKLTDPAFQGFQELIPKFHSCPSDLVISTGKWLLERTPSLALKLFLELSSRKGLAFEAVEAVEASGQRSLLAQLLPAVLPSLPAAEPSRETQLGLLYADLITRPEAESALSESELRDRLQRLLLQSGDFEAETLLRRLESAGAVLATEAAFLKGRLGDHLGALELLVGADGDTAAAEKYVAFMSEGRSRREKRELHTALFRLLLGLREKGDLPVHRILRLLNQPGVELDPAEVLRSLPERWALGPLVGFLRRSGEARAERSREAALGRGLSGASEEAVRRELARLTATRTPLSETERCAVCGSLFVEAAAVRYPLGALLHPACLRHEALCPKTATLHPRTRLTAPPVEEAKGNTLRL